MRFESKKAKSARLEKRHNELRTVRKFLFFPKSFGNETRWLEFAYVNQRFYFHPDVYAAMYHVHQASGWEDLGFATITDFTAREIVAGKGQNL